MPDRLSFFLFVMPLLARFRLDWELLRVKVVLQIVPRCPESKPKKEIFPVDRTTTRDLSFLCLCSFWSIVHLIDNLGEEIVEMV